MAGEETQRALGGIAVATQHDGIGSYRALHFVSDCSCFQYVGPLRPAA